MVSTKQVAHLFRCSPARIQAAIYRGRVPEPQRSPSGGFLWSDDAIDGAARVLLGVGLADLLARRGAADLGELLAEVAGPVTRPRIDAGLAGLGHGDVT